MKLVVLIIAVVTVVALLYLNIGGKSDGDAYSGEGDRQFCGNVTDGFNLPHWKLKRNVSGHDQSTFSVFS